MKQNPIFAEGEPLYESNLRREQRPKKWDMFRDPPGKVKSGSMKQTTWINFAEKFGKVAAYIITFCVVLGCGIISKGTLLFMTSQISTEVKPFCNKYLDRNKQFTVKLPQEERVAWIWMVMFTFFAPQIGIFIRSVRKILYKSWTRPTNMEAFAIFLTESFSTIGSAMLVFVILPRLDVVRGIMLMNAFCIVPAILSLLSNFDWRALTRNDNDEDENDIIDSSSNVNNRNRGIILKIILDAACILAQITVLFLWPAVEYDASLWCIPACAILISCSWWENYVSENSKFSFIRVEAAKKKIFENSRYFIYVFVSLWKCLLFFISMLVIFWIEHGSAAFLFDDFDVAFSTHPINITEVIPIINLDIDNIISSGPGTTIDSYHLTPVWVFLINVLSSYICYGFAKFACKVYIQGFSFAFPLNLTVPVGITGLIAMCGIYKVDECSFRDTIPMYLFFDLPTMFKLSEFIGQQQSWIWLLWLISQAWITVHIWTPTSEKSASTERLFVRPLFDPFLVDQDIALNRRRNDKPLKTEDELEYEDIADLINRIDSKSIDESDTITRIYACGTMWHEEPDEMMEFLKSIMRLDEDQSAKRIAKEELKFDIPDYYELETHIFFDDAFERPDKTNRDPRINKYVKSLVETVDDAASDVHEVRIRLRPPTSYPTPYGGRLVWTLPGKTKIIAHLKDAKKIKAKKRWSQVMYMYYLLGHKLMDRDDLTTRRKEIRAEHTYILALDGDIDFQPNAVHLLVDLMKKNKSLGAACGRIHPTGSGPMVWYQMFEYAIGHWLQKSTEHVIGCVLCSPGCFSLFRGKALMDDNVMKKYTTVSTEARHYVQYDQGEDRWLCTLLLQRGYRVEYSAASDAFTQCPQSFKVFYNQRRRWMPSTTANILDLLMDYKATVKVNDNISRFYILYQIVLLLGTVLGAGTIFLMLVGAFVAAFQLDPWSSFIWNIVPIAIFMLTCGLFSNENIQLFVAGVLSAMYSLIMMAVLVGIILQINNDGFFAPSSLFFFFVALQMIISGLMHPKEFNCLPFGLVYYVTVPSMYMLLVIYAVFNMNNISWGTREDPADKKPNANASEEVKEEEKKPKPKNTILSFFGANGNDNKGAFEFSLASLFKCMLCTHRDEKEDESLKQINTRLDALMMQLAKLENMVVKPPPEEMPAHSRTTMVSGLKMEPEESPSVLEWQVEEVEENNWIEDEVLQRGDVEFINGRELDFWNELLDTYLQPTQDDEDYKNKTKEKLKDLRDKAVMAFFMINALFILIIFLLTLNRDLIYIRWPLGVQVNFTYTEDGEIIMHKEHLQLEPIGIVFVLLFATLLSVQFIAMFIHRFETFSQIISNTTISFNVCKSKKEELTKDEILEMNSVECAKKLQRLKGVDNESEDNDKKEAQPSRRLTVHKLMKFGGQHREATIDLEKAFERRMKKYKDDKKYHGPVRRETVMAIDDRKSRLMRASQAPFMRPTFGRDGTINVGPVEEGVSGSNI